MPTANLAATFNLVAEYIPLDFPDINYPGYTVPNPLGGDLINQAPFTVKGGPLIQAQGTAQYPSFSIAGYDNVMAGIGSFANGSISSGGNTTTYRAVWLSTYTITGGYKSFDFVSSGGILLKPITTNPSSFVAPYDSQYIDTITGQFTTAQAANGSLYAAVSTGPVEQIGAHPTGLVLPFNLTGYDLSDAGDDFNIQNYTQGINQSPFYMTRNWIVANVNQLPAFILQLLMILPDWSQYARLNITGATGLEAAILANAITAPTANVCVQYDPANGYFMSTQDKTTGKISLFILSPYNPANQSSVLPQQGATYNPATDGAFPGFSFNAATLYGNRRFAAPGVFALGNKSLLKCCSLTEGGSVVQSLYPTAAGTR